MELADVEALLQRIAQKEDIRQDAGDLAARSVEFAAREELRRLCFETRRALAYAASSGLAQPASPSESSGRQLHGEFRD